MSLIGQSLIFVTACFADENVKRSEIACCEWRELKSEAGSESESSSSSESESSSSPAPECSGWSKIDQNVKDFSVDIHLNLKGMFCADDKTGESYKCVSGPGATYPSMYISNPCPESMKVVSENRQLYHKHESATEPVVSSDSEPKCNGWKIIDESVANFGTDTEQNLQGYYCTKAGKSYKCVSGPGATYSGLYVRKPCEDSMKVVSGKASTEAPSAPKETTTTPAGTPAADSPGSQCSGWTEVSTGDLTFNGGSPSGVFCSANNINYKCNDDGTDGLYFINCPPGVAGPSGPPGIPDDREHQHNYLLI